MIPKMKSAEGQSLAEELTRVKTLSEEAAIKSQLVTFEELEKGFNILNEFSSRPMLYRMWGSSSEEIESLGRDLINIFKKKVELTKKLMGINGENKSPARKDNNQKEIDFPKTIDHPAKNFQGYERRQIFGTATEMPKEIQSLIPLADTKEKVDKVAEVLISKGRIEDALNLSIDLYEKYNLGDRVAAERNFMFFLLPRVKGVKIDDPENKPFQNLTLNQWIEYLNDTRELMKSKASSVNLIVKEAKEESKKYEGKEFHITMKSQSELNKYRREVVNENDILDMVAKELKVATDDLIWDAVNDTDEKTLKAIRKKVFNTGKIEDAKVVMNLAEFKNTILGKMKSLVEGSGGGKEIYNYFKENVKNISDYDCKNDEAKVKELWEIIRNTHKQQKEDEKNKVVEDAHNKAVEMQNNTDKAPAESNSLVDKFKADLKKLVVAGKGLNDARILYKASKKELKKAGFSEHDLENTFNKIKEEHKQNDKASKKEDEPKNLPLVKLTNVAAEYPEIWAESMKCKTLEDLTKFISKMMEESTKDIKAASGMIHTKYTVALNLVGQRVKDIPECKDWDPDKVFKWWENFKDKHVENITGKPANSPLKGKESSGITNTEGSIKKEGTNLGEGKDGGKTIPTGEKNKQPADGVKETNTAGKTVSDSAIQPKDGEGKSLNAQDKPAGTITEVTKNVSENVKLKTEKEEGKPGEESTATIQSIDKDSGKNVNSELAGQETLEKNDAASMENVQKKDGDPKPGEEDAHLQKDSGKTTQNGDQSGQESVKENAIAENQENVQQNIHGKDKKPDNLGEGQSSTQNAGVVQKPLENGNSIDSTSLEPGSAKVNGQEGSKEQNVDGKKPDATGSAASEESAKTNGETLDSLCESIPKEKDTKKINEIIKSVLLNSSILLTFREKVEAIAVKYLPKNRKWDNNPYREILKHISAVVEKIPELKNSDEAKALQKEIKELQKKAEEEKREKNGKK